ncbi:MAG: amidohydrolase [Alphaproteobacteria bacterium HGW-Alphaproteobacteria-18]|nr:MAG: amidohydrolase [Alphaproteobacteria bacterium HGW-Alphaproteobacteria-18]
MNKLLLSAGLGLCLVLSACGGSGDGKKKSDVPRIFDPFPSTYAAYPSGATLITGATVLDGKGGLIEGGSVLIEGGKIKAIGADLTAPEGATTINAAGKWVTPGIIDNHSHLGAYPSPGVEAHGDGNEISGPVTAEVWVEHSVWPQDPGFTRALAGGITSLQILPGSANLFGGRGVVLKNVPARTVQAMKFPGAPHTLKMACGENPKRVYGYGRGAYPGGAPYSRMGNVAGYRTAWIQARDYKKKWDAFIDGTGDEPARDLELETLAGALSGDILVHMHCYRADEMAIILDLSQEFGYKVASFHHAVEAYKIADKLAEYGTCSSMWADWWGFKMEAYDGIRENIPMVHNAGACAIVHSDSDIGIQRLNQEAAKAWSDGKRAGIDIPIEVAWQWLSLNPAKSLGIDGKTGSLEPGKMADVVVWSANPFSVYAQAEKVYIDGALMYDRNDPAIQPVMDFELGQPGEGDRK